MCHSGRFFIFLDNKKLKNETIDALFGKYLQKSFG